MFPLRQLLSSDDDKRNDDFNKDWDEAAEHAGTAVKISMGIIIAIVVGIVLFIIISVVVCVYCVCKRRTVSRGAVVQRGGPQVTTYQFPSASQQPAAGYPQYPLQPTGPQYPPYPQYPQPGRPQYPQPGPPQYPQPGPPQHPQPGPPQAYTPTSTAGGGWGKPDAGLMAPPPYSPPTDYSAQQKASAPPLDY